MGRHRHYRHHHHGRKSKVSLTKRGGRGLGIGGLSLFSVGVGILGGIVLSHIFRSTIDKVWGEIPGLNSIKSNYGYYY